MMLNHLITSYNLIVVVVFVYINVVSTQNDYKQCDKTGIHFYEELGCQPKFNESNPCPVSYKCPNYEIPNGKCLFYGQVLNNGDEANGSYCNQDFHCEAEPNEKGKLVSYLIIDCYFGPPADGCYRGGELRRCCQSDYCPAPNETVYTCQVGGATYKENETFTPDGTCYNCVCKPGFTGVYEEPFCIRRPCDMELRNAQQLEDKCAPVYYHSEETDALCCPFDFLCPNKVLSIEIKTKTDNSHHKCKLGDKEFNLNEEIRVTYNSSWSTNQTNDCSCLVPPYLACTITS